VVGEFGGIEGDAMFIVWGTKIVRRNLGRTADFCRLCRDFQPSRVVEVGSVGHLYYIPLGRRTPHGLEQTCESCGLLRSIQPSESYPAVVRDRHADVEGLLFETNPNARQIWADRLAVEDRIRGNRLAPEERLPALIESFLLANTLLANRTTGMQFDRASGFGCFGTIAAFVLTIVVAESLFKASNESKMIAAFSIAGALALCTLILLATDGRRYARRVILPVLVRAIRPIRPTAEEIAAVLEVLRSNGVKLGKVLKTDQVVDALTFAEQ
jgi:hypothetical protein